MLVQPLYTGFTSMFFFQAGKPHFSRQGGAALNGRDCHLLGAVLFAKEGTVAVPALLSWAPVISCCGDLMPAQAACSCDCCVALMAICLLCPAHIEMCARPRLLSLRCRDWPPA